MQTFLSMLTGYNFFIRSLLCKLFRGYFSIIAPVFSVNTYGSDISKSVFLKGMEIWIHLSATRRYLCRLKSVGGGARRFFGYIAVRRQGSKFCSNRFPWNRHRATNPDLGHSAPNHRLGVNPYRKSAFKKVDLRPKSIEKRSIFEPKIS